MPNNDIDPRVQHLKRTILTPNRVQKSGLTIRLLQIASLEVVASTVDASPELSIDLFRSVKKLYKSDTTKQAIRQLEARMLVVEFRRYRIDDTDA